MNTAELIVRTLDASKSIRAAVDAKCDPEVLLHATGIVIRYLELKLTKLPEDAALLARVEAVDKIIKDAESKDVVLL